MCVCVLGGGGGGVDVGVGVRSRCDSLSHKMKQVSKCSAIRRIFHYISATSLLYRVLSSHWTKHILRLPCPILYEYTS